MITFILLLFFSFYFCILDLRIRRIPIKNFKILFYLTLFYIFFTFYFFDITLFFRSIFLFTSYFILLFVLCFIFYVIKLIGGGDSKYLFFLSIFHFYYSMEVINLIDFFIIFTLIYFTLYIPNLLKNQIYYRLLHEQFLFSLNIRKGFFGFYLKLCFKFLPLKSIQKFDDIKYKIRSFSILYDFKTRSLYFLSQYKMPVIMICFLSYIFYLILNFCAF